MRIRKRKSHHIQWMWVRMLIVIGVVLTLLLFFYARLRPVVEKMAAYEAKIFAVRTVNDVLLQELDSSEIGYSDLVLLSRDREGNVTSIQTDIVNVNRLKAGFSTAVVAQLEAVGEQSVWIPLGTLLGNEFFSGRGPLIEVKMIPTGYVQTELSNQFVSAGINQTLHQIMLKTTVQMEAILPGYTVKTESTTSFCIAETVIVGSIPESYTQINGDDSPLISKINDYANP